jgi:signal peptidase I
VVNVNTSKETKPRSEILSWIKTIALALILTWLISNFLFEVVVVNGKSMMPNLQNGNRLIISKISPIHRFDEIVFKAPDSNENYVKRVIGLPGDTIEMKNDTLYIDGKKYLEPYLNQYKKTLTASDKMTNDFTLEEITHKGHVPNGYVFVLGDNRLVSKDSRHFGFVPEKSIEGKIELRIWPFNEFGKPQ